MTRSTYRQSFSDAELDILKARADRLAQLEKGQEQGERLIVLSVKVGSESYALPIESIASVYEGLHVTHVPCVPPAVAGVANVRGRIILVLDLRTLLKVPGGASQANVLITLADDDLELALWVDAIRDVESIPAAALAPTPANVDLQKPGYIRGLFPDGLALLDLTSIANDPLFS